MLLFRVDHAGIDLIKLCFQLHAKATQLRKARAASNRHSADHINQLAGVDRHEKITSQAIRKQKARILLRHSALK